MPEEILMADDSHVIVRNDKYDFSVTVNDLAHTLFLDDRVTLPDHKTVGELNREYLHKKLDEFINGVIS